MSAAEWSHLVLLLNAGSTWAMMGLIWFVQVVHYPLFAGVGDEGFAAYEARHTRRTTWVVAPLMLTELVTSLALLAWVPAGVAMSLVWAGLATVAINWVSTALLQVPAHGVLAKGFSAQAHARLVGTNWLRTGAWTTHGVIAAAMVWQALRTLN